MNGANAFFGTTGSTISDNSNFLLIYAFSGCLA